MPYVQHLWRLRYQKDLEKVISKLVEDTFGGRENNGVVVYIIYSIIKKIYGRDASNFEVKSNALKVLRATELEFYRRVMAPYEDKKIQENGDI